MTKAWPPVLLALSGGSVITLVGSITTAYPVAVIAMLPATLVSFGLWGGPESISPKANDPVLIAIAYAVNVLAWAAIFWLPARRFWRWTQIRRQRGVA